MEHEFKTGKPEGGDQTYEKYKKSYNSRNDYLRRLKLPAATPEQLAFENAAHVLYVELSNKNLSEEKKTVLTHKFINDCPDNGNRTYNDYNYLYLKRKKNELSELPVGTTAQLGFEQSASANTQQDFNLTSCIPNQDEIMLAFDPSVPDMMGSDLASGGSGSASSLVASAQSSSASAQQDFNPPPSKKGKRKAPPVETLTDPNISDQGLGDPSDFFNSLDQELGDSSDFLGSLDQELVNPSDFFGSLNIATQGGIPQENDLGRFSTPSVMSRIGTSLTSGGSAGGASSSKRQRI